MSPPNSLQPPTEPHIPTACLAVAWLASSQTAPLTNLLPGPCKKKWGKKGEEILKKALTDHPPEGFGKKCRMPSTRHTHTTPTPSSCWKTRMQKSTGALLCMHSPISASTLDLPCAWSSSEKDVWGEGRDFRIGSRQVTMSTEGKIGPWALSTAAHSCSAGQPHGPSRCSSCLSDMALQGP